MRGNVVASQESARRGNFLISYPPEVRVRYPLREHEPTARALRRALDRYLRPGIDALDIGCGMALGACHLAASGADGVIYLGVEPDPDECRRARQVLARLPANRVAGRVLKRSIQEYVAGTTSPVDLILMDFAFHECVQEGDPESRAAMAVKIADLLAPGGILIVGEAYLAGGASAEERERFHEYNRRAAGPGDSGKPHVAPAVIADLFTEAGLSMVEDDECALFALARYLGMPHARYRLLILRRTPR